MLQVPTLTYYLFFRSLGSTFINPVAHPTWQRTRVDDPNDLHTGWSLDTGALSSPNGSGIISVTGCTGDPINGAKFIRDLYELSGDNNKKYTVPVLWDKVTKSIVNNESSDVSILVIFNA